MNRKRKDILEELNRFYELKEDMLGNKRIELYTMDGKIQSVSIQKKFDPTFRDIKSYFPVVKMSDGDELIILCPSNPIRKTRTLEESLADAEFVEKRINELLDIR